MELLLAHRADIKANSPGIYRYANVVSGPHADRDDRKGGGDTPLHVAVRSGNSAMIHLLLDNGADVNTKDVLGHAFLTDDPRIVRLLLDRGAKLDAKMRSNLLHSVIDNRELLEILLALTPQKELSGELGESLLNRAAEQKEAELVKLLESRGAPLSIFAACILGRKERVAELLAADPGLPRTKREEYPRKLLTIAASHGHLDVVKLLVSSGASLTGGDKWDSTALEAAAQGGHRDVAAYLIEEGADVNHRNMYASTPLHAAAGSGNLDVVKLLIERKADVNLRDISRNTVLHEAARNGAMDVVRYFVKLGLPVDVRNDFSETSLHLAAENGNTEMASLLLKLGADVNARNRRGQSSLFYAEKEYDPAYFSDGPDRKAVANLLRDHGGEK